MKAAKPVSAILTIGVLVVALSACGVSKPKVNYYQADKQAMSQVLPGLQGTYSDIAKGKITSQEVIALPPKINFAAYVNVECLNGTCTDTYSQKYPEQSYVFTPPLDTCEIIVGTDLTDVDSASFDHYYNVMSTARWGLMSNGQAIGQFCSFPIASPAIWNVKDFVAFDSAMWAQVKSVFGAQDASAPASRGSEESLNERVGS